MHRIEVGKELVPGHGPWPELSEFNLLDTGPELMLRFAGPTAAEVEAVRAGPCAFALAEAERAFFFLYTFGTPGAGVPWSDAPYCCHLVPEGRRPGLALFATAATRWALQVVLLEAGTGIVRAVRLVTFSAGFTRELARAVQRQGLGPAPRPEEWGRRVAAAYRRYPSTEALLAAALARTEGGA
jgi:hypothetical protein